MPDRDRPAAYADLVREARAEAENFGAAYPHAAGLLRSLADAVEGITGTETVRLVHPDGGRVLIELPIDVGVFAKVGTALAKGGFEFDRTDAPPPRDAALTALVALLADGSVRAAMAPEHLELARAAGWKASHGD